MKSMLTDAISQDRRNKRWFVLHFSDGRKGHARAASAPGGRVS
jgi:hypothetical protein